MALFIKVHKKKPIREIKYFHPSGGTMPNGHPIQRGGFSRECRINSEAYELDEAVHPQQYGLADYRGGVITFSTDVNAVEYSKNAIVNKVKQLLATYGNRLFRQSKIAKVIKSFNDKDGEYIGAFSVGNFFKGRYVGDNGKIYDEKSISVEINGLSSKGLFELAEKLCTEFQQETVLVKDFNTNKIYLVDADESQEPLDREMWRINTKV